MARKIPTIRITLTSGANYEHVIKDDYVRVSIIKESVLAIKEGLKNKRKSTPLFIINDGDFIFHLEKNQWKTSLEIALKHYESLEEYTMCSEIHDIIKSL